jgi:TonB-dependent receptor
MKLKSTTTRRLRSGALFTIVGGVVVINPAFAQQPATSPVGSQTKNEALEEVVVTGLRASLEASMDIKRDAVGVVDAITAEDMGKFPDTNLAESLQRITGISIDRRNGEGAQVSARGFGPQFNLVTLNGRQIPGADGFGNGEITIGGQGSGTRSFNFAQLASEAISSVEVYKTSRADLSSGGIGATVNIKTARPFDHAGTIFNLGAKGVYDESSPFDSEITPEISGIFSTTNDDRTWGVGLSASYQKRHGGSIQFTENAWNIQAWEGTSGALRPDATVTNAPDIGQLYGMPNDMRYAFSDFERERINAQGVVQFAPSDALTLTLDYTFAGNDITENRGEQTIWLQRNGSFTDLTFDTGEEVATPIFLRDIVGGKDFGFEQQRNEQRNRLNSLGFNVAWRVTDNFTLGLDAHDSKTKSLPNDPSVRGASATFFSFAGTNCVSSTCTGAFSQEFTFNNGLPIMARTFFPTLTDAVANTNGTKNADFTASQLGSQMLRIWSFEQESEVKEGRLDGALDFDNGRFQFGIDTRSTEMNRKNGYGEAVLGNWSASDATGVPGMVALLRPFSMTGLFDDFSTAGAAGGAWRGDADALARWGLGFTSPVDGHVYRWNPDNTTTANDCLCADPALDDNNTIKEDVNAAYVQYAMRFDLGSMPSNLLIGVRYEDTEVTSTSNILVPNSPGGMIWTANNDFTIGRSATVQPFTEKTDYNHVLPSLDFDVMLTDSIKGRVSYSKTIARANYTDLYAGATVRGATGSILIDPSTQASADAQNPALVPLESDNVDLSLEWYFADQGYVSAGFWQKRVDNFIGTTVLQQSLFDITDPTSGPDAQSALAFLQSAACVTQVTAAGEDVNAACSANDTALFTALAMLRNEGATGGLAAYDGSSAQILDMENRFDITGEADDPLYTFAVRRPVNQEKAKIHGWELGGQYFFGDTGFGLQANYTIVKGDVGFNNNAPPGTTQFALLGLSDTANAVLVYEKYGITARLAYNWRDEFLAATNQNGSSTNPYYVEAYDQIDLSVGYQFNDALSFQVEAVNLTGEDIRWHARSEKQVVRLEDQQPRYALGVRYKF